MNCPNNHGELVTQGNKEVCKVCGYSFTKKVFVKDLKTKKKGQGKAIHFISEDLKKSLNSIVEDIECHLFEKTLLDEHLPWKNKRWLVTPKRNYITFNQYHGWNRVFLFNQKDDLFVTEKQIEGIAKKHEDVSLNKDNPIKVMGWFPKQKKKDESDQDFKDRIAKTGKFAAITRTIYPISDAVNLPEKKVPEDLNLAVKDKDIDSFIARLKVNIIEGTNDSFYSFSNDAIMIPKISKFLSTDMYYVELFKQIAHWTAHENRLNRKDESLDNKFREEMTCEMVGSALCNMFNIKTVEDSAERIDEWIMKLKNDQSVLLEATTRAEKVLDFINKL
jgi:hypothetical protein